jgi:hypothetical protein
MFPFGNTLDSENFTINWSEFSSTHVVALEVAVSVSYFCGSLTATKMCPHEPTIRAHRKDFVTQNLSL